ncbi:MAG TPA: cephalosporin hydroxylase family protein [Polyangia bacterium]|jgi:cephalosporin hydroxylase|nr:cephalosporin hydroxylase family protein [Polyangia bacterium]
MSDEATRFAEERRRDAAAMDADVELKQLSRNWFDKSYRYRYSYNFTWLGRPIIQYPEDIVAIQELLWRVQPDLVVETGVAHGGSLILSASILALLGRGSVIGIDVDIRKHNREAIEAHPLAKGIQLIEGSSTDDKVVADVFRRAAKAERIVVFLDSNHTHEHVRRELELYSPLVRKGSYLVVFDTVIEEMPDAAFSDRPWARGDNPMTAVREFLKLNPRFSVDEEFEQRLPFSVAPSGYLRCTADPASK